MRARSPVRSPLRPPTPRGSPTVPAGVHLVVPPDPGRRSPETLAVHLLVPRPSSRRPRRRRARGGRRGWAEWCIEPPEALVIRAVPHPNPKVRRVGFTLDDPYVEQVWAGVIGPSALLVLRRLPVLWREREPALVDLRELGQSLGLGPSLARSGARGRPSNGSSASGWPTGCRATSSACAPRWRRSAAASSHGCPGGPARSTTGCSACTSTGSLAPTDRTLCPDRFLDTARVTARLDHLQHRRPAITRCLGLRP
jgi:hypothetical protein